VEGLFPLLLLALAFVLLIILPQRARNRAAQRTQQMQSALAVGIEIMTTSGLYGTIADIGDTTIDLEIAPGVVVTWAKAAIGQVVTPIPDPDSEPEAPAEPTAE
jgi:preprotein translocase subunit YajC